MLKSTFADGGAGPQVLQLVLQAAYQNTELVSDEVLTELARLQQSLAGFDETVERLAAEHCELVAK